MLCVIDAFARENLAIRLVRRLKATDVIDVLADPFILRGIPTRIRSGNGPEYAAKALREWIAAVGAKTAYIQLAPLGNGYSNPSTENSRRTAWISYTLNEANIVIEGWRRHYNTAPPHSSLDTDCRRLRYIVWPTVKAVAPMQTLN